MAKKIIHYQGGSSSSSTPSSIATNHAYIDSLPLDGIVVRTPSFESGLLAPSNVASYATLLSDLSPMVGVLSSVTHNYVLVVIRGNVDVFDDWTQIIANWSAAAHAAKDSGLEGIFFDNEEYFEQVWNYPTDVAHSGSHTNAQYAAQFYLRGQQVMTAMLAQWPAIKVIVAHGAYVSDSRTPASVALKQISVADTDLRGEFLTGMFSQAPGQVIDGGEVYQYRLKSDFAASYLYRKTTQPGLSSNLVIPSAIASSWTSSSDISFGLYDTAWQNGYTISADTFQSDITYGLSTCDSLVWTYSDSQFYLTPGSVDPSWIWAIANAKASAAFPTPSCVQVAFAESSGTTLQCAFPSSVSSGNLLVMMVFWTSTGAPTLTPSDTLETPGLNTEALMLLTPAHTIKLCITQLVVLLEQIHQR